MKSCGSCIHIQRFTLPFEGRGQTLIGVCAHPTQVNWGRTHFCAALTGSMCGNFESDADARVGRALQQLEVDA